MNFTDITKDQIVVLLGRGPTARYYKKKKNDFVIGYNYDFKTNKEIDAVLKGSKIYLRDSDKFFSIDNYNFKVGSVKFTLINFLFFFDSILKKKQRLQLYGFDFKKFSTDDDIFKMKRILKKNSSIQENIDINSQLSTFINYKDTFKNLDIQKFGYDFYSDHTHKKSKDLEIIAEFTTNHQGDTSRLIKLFDYSIKAGCRVIKLQKRNVESFYSKKELEKKYITPLSKTFYEYRNKLELNEEQIDIVKNYKKKYDLKIIFSALDVISYQYLKKKGFKYFKIPSTISEHKKFINYIANHNNNLLYISTGMTNQKYLNFILNTFKNKKIVLMHAISSYPTHFTDINLGILKNYVKYNEKNKNIIPGYSSHDIGEIGSMLAVACGAKVIEKHVKIGTTDWMHYDDTAVDAKLEFRTFINSLNKVYASIGSTDKKVYKFENHKYRMK